MKKALSILAFSVPLGRNFQLHLRDGGCFLMNCAAKGDPLVPPKLSWKTYQRKCSKHRGLKGSLLSAPPIPRAAFVPGLGDMELPLSLVSGKICYNLSSLQQSALRWCWERLAGEGWLLLIPFSLENRAWVSCMNSADLLLLFLFCFSVSFHQFPQLSVTIWAALDPCSRSRNICNPADRSFLWISSEIARQKWFACSRSESRAETLER